MCIGHAKISIFSNAGELRKNSGNKGKFTGIPPKPVGIPLLPTGVPTRTDCTGVSFWIFEFVRYWAVYRPYRSVYRYRGSAVRHLGSVGRTLAIARGRAEGGWDRVGWARGGERGRPEGAWSSERKTADPIFFSTSFFLVVEKFKAFTFCQLCAAERAVLTIIICLGMATYTLRRTKTPWGEQASDSFIQRQWQQTPWGEQTSDSFIQDRQLDHREYYHYFGTSLAYRRSSIWILGCLKS
jgi:hypothetical protein